jgi:hypothetical protein
MTTTIDDEWASYLSMQNIHGNLYKSTKKVVNTTQKVYNVENKKSLEILDMDDVVVDVVDVVEKNVLVEGRPFLDKMELNISTKTKVLFLNRAIDIHSIFWNIPIIDYWNPVCGVIKKQIKVVSKTPEEYEEYRSKLVGIRYYQENIIKQIDNPEARSIKFKDERKVTIGLSRKDIITYRSKVKNAFYNCFALVIRFKYNEEGKTYLRRYT